nr:MAG TPA: hypothetical protein [Caudoviricetes sp.]
MMQLTKCNMNMRHFVIRVRFHPKLNRGFLCNENFHPIS